MTDAHGVARDQLRAFIERIERLEEEKKTIADDIKDIYGEAKGCGFDTKILREVIKIRKQDRDERAEREAILDSYLAALGMIDQPSFFDDEPSRPAPVERRPAAALRADNGLNIVTRHKDIQSSPETATEIHANPEEVGARGETVSAPAVDAGSRPVAGRSAAATSEAMDVTGGESAATNHDMDRATEGSFETGSEAAEKGRKATATVAAPADLSHAGAGESPATAITIPSGDHVSLHDRSDAAANAGGNDVDRNALRVPTSVTGEGAACALPDSGEVVQEYVPPVPMKRLGYAHCFPELTKAQYGRLEFSISGLGIKNPIIRMGDVIIDGWARYNIARSLGIDYPVKSYDGKDVLLDVIEWQRASREFTPAQEAKIAADLAKEIPHRADDIMAAFGLAEALEAAE
jgi:uncharacterized protein (UPF0335 family)